MYLIDFIYNNVRLSDKGCMVGYITTGNENTVSLGSELTLNTIKNNSTNKFGLTSTSYDNVISASFDIFKSPCTNGTDIYFNLSEIEDMMRWLNKRTYQTFVPIFDDDTENNISFNGTFTNVQAIHLNGKIVGFSVNFVTNSPFGYSYPPIIISKDAESDTLTINSSSRELGYLYPSKFIITVNAAGTLTISNSAENLRCVVDNCVISETITIDCENKIITSSKAHEKLYNDFNYNYPRLITTEMSDENVFTFSLPCEVQVEFAPIRKVGMFA